LVPGGSGEHFFVSALPDLYVYGVLGLDRAAKALRAVCGEEFHLRLVRLCLVLMPFIGRCAAKASRSVRREYFTFTHITAPAEFSESPTSSLLVLFLDLLDVGRWLLSWFGECSSSALYSVDRLIVGGIVESNAECCIYPSLRLSSLLDDG
jgi:hypothetical protein